jgi:hydrogenase maturation factor HypF (carbamoyltransferase family)
LQRTSQLLRVQGLTVLSPQALPANDGGISLGQAVVALASER